jgi:hypothetical protein
LQARVFKGPAEDRRSDVGATFAGEDVLFSILRYLLVQHLYSPTNRLKTSYSNCPRGDL